MSSFEALKAKRDKKGKAPARPADSSATLATTSTATQNVAPKPRLDIDDVLLNGASGAATADAKGKKRQTMPLQTARKTGGSLLPPSLAQNGQKAKSSPTSNGTVPDHRGGPIESFAAAYPASHPRVSLKAHPDNPKRGRSVFAKKALKAVLSFAPHAAALDTTYLQRRCSACFLEDADFSAIDERDKGKQVRRCTKCFLVSYCCAACQRLDWPSHKPECAALTAFGIKAEELERQAQKSKAPEDDSREEYARVPSTPVRALARLMWRKERESPVWWQSLLELENHFHLCDAAQKEKLMQLALALSRFVGPALIKQTLGSAQDLLSFCSRFTDNSFGLTSPTLDNIGVVICPPAALINHSCTPNAVVVFPEGGEGAGKRAGKEWVRIVAIRPIAPGEEILTSYVDLSATARERRDDLKARYFFDCTCAACTAEPSVSNPDPRETVKCPECTTWFEAQSFGVGTTEPASRPASRPSTPNPDADFELRNDAGPSDGVVKPEVTCPSCGFSRVMDIEGQRIAIKKSGVSVNGPQYLTFDPEKAAHYADRAIEWLQLKLSPFTCSGAFYPVLDLRRLKLVAHLLCTKDRIKHLSAAGQDIPKIIDGLARVYGNGHPVTAVTKATVAKLCVSTFNARATDPCEEPSRVITVLKSIKDRHINALEDIAIGFGPSSRVGRSVAEAVVLLDEEMAAWERLRQERRPE